MPPLLLPELLAAAPAPNVNPPGLALLVFDAPKENVLEEEVVVDDEAPSPKGAAADLGDVKEKVEVAALEEAEEVALLLDAPKENVAPEEDAGVAPNAKFPALAEGAAEEVDLNVMVGDDSSSLSSLAETFFFSGVALGGS